MPRFVTRSRPTSAQHPLTEFYRQEFLKHKLCLQQQRPYYSESAITDVEAALTKIMGQLEQLCSQDNADQLVSALLKQFDVVTGLSSWSHCRAACSTALRARRPVAVRSIASRTGGHAERKASCATPMTG